MQHLAYVLPMLADTNVFDFLVEIVKLVSLGVATVAAVIAAMRAGRAETKTDTAAKEARGGRLAAQTAATVVVESTQLQTDALNKVVEQGQRVEQNTNGKLEAKERDYAALQAKYEALLVATPPPAVVDKIDKIDKVIGSVVKAHESGVIRIETPADPAHPPHRRATDPHP